MCMYTEAWHMWVPQNYLYMIHLKNHTLQDVYIYITYIYIHIRMIFDSLYVWICFFLSVALCFRPQNTPQDWAFAALMSIGLMELSHLAMQEGR